MSKRANVLVDPETGKKITGNALYAKLRLAEESRAACKTTMGDFGCCVKIAALCIALGLPIPSSFNKEFYGKRIKWETARFENGVATIDFENDDMGKTEAPQTKDYLLQRLNILERSTNEARWHEEKLAKEINVLEIRRKDYARTLAQELEERNHLLKLFKELGGNEWEITG